MIAGLDIENEDQGAEEGGGDGDEEGDSEDDGEVSKHLAVGKPSREDGEGVKFGSREGIDLTTSLT